MKPPETDRRGKKPIPVWIDGIRIESSTLALSELGLQSSNGRRHRYYRALDGCGVFEGHTVSHHPPEPTKKADPAPIKERRAGDPLLVEPCRHRLGVWLGGQW